jgi:excisionase family DNA binding protein
MTVRDLHDLPLVLDVATVAEALDVAPGTVRAAIRRGEIRVLALGRAWRIPRGELVRLLEGARLNGDGPPT